MCSGSPLPSLPCLPGEAWICDWLRKVDLYDNNVVGQKLSGDGWRRRHDDMKEKIMSLLPWAGLEVRCEVFN